MRPRFPDHAELIFLGASAILLFWIVATVTGGHPDGAVLGFSATLYLIWRDMAKSEAHRRKHRKKQSQLEAEAQGKEERDHPRLF